MDFGRGLEAGDYGKVDPDTGEFEYHGNIYRKKEVLELVPELKEPEYQVHESDPIKHWVITADKTQEGDVDFSPSASVMGIADASIKVQFKFKAGHRGAFLVMYRPKTHDLPKDVLLHKLHELEPLKGMYLVTSVVCCPAYALNLSNRDAENVRLAFVGNLPIPAAPGVSAGGEVGAGWVAENKSGLYQEGCDITGKYKYRPLYTMKRMRNWGWPIFRDSPAPELTGDDLWLDAEPPWTSLDENGEEDEFYDEVMD
jgi:hypothetical protein